MWKDWKVAKKAALYFVLFYITISCLWVLFSDYIFTRNLSHLPVWMNSGKGLLFILLSGFLFYNLIQKMITDIIKEDRNYRLIVENVSDLILVINRDGGIEYVSPSLQSIVGYPPEDYIGKTVREAFKEEEIIKMIDSYIRNKQNVPIKFSIKNRHGRKVLLEGKAVSITEQGDIGRYVVLVQDITDRSLAENKLLESEERYRKLVEFSPETTLIHKNREIVYVNQSGLDLVGADNVDQIIGKDLLDFIPHEDISQAVERMVQVQEGVSEINEYRINRLDGSMIYVEILAFKTTYQGDEAVQIIVRDISERKKAAEQVHFLAYYDSLTGIPNRNLLYDDLLEAVIRNEKNEKIFAVMFLDLDRFKMINDTYGHSFGDILLQQVSARLTNSLESKGRIYRYGGDEFIIVLEQIEMWEISQVAKNIVYSLSSPFLIKDRQTFISTSIGISIYPMDGDNVESLIQNSDIAMYKAKQNGKNTFQYYSSSFNHFNRRNMDIEIGLRNAIKNNEFSLYYQPQVDLDSNKIIGLEALLRWKHPEYGFISPAEFIPVAEETGIIYSIGKWVLKTACNQCKQWLDRGFSIVNVAVNVSALQFREKNFVSMIEQILQDIELQPGYLELEITESVTSQVDEAVKKMKELKEIGIHLSIDDFGTGYSSLNYLRHFPIDKLKIDKSFIDEINIDVNGEVIVRTIIDLGNSLCFKVIAEGVENIQQINFLQENNCHFAQGFYFNKPLPAEEIEEVLRKQI